MTEKPESEVPGGFQGGSRLDKGRTVSKAAILQPSQLFPFTPGAINGFRALN